MGLRNRTLFIDDHCFFVTTTCNKWYHLLEMDACKQIVCDSVNFLSKKYATCVFGYVIMPNHLHLLIYFNEQNRLSDWMRDLKKYTAFRIRQQIEQAGQVDLLEKLRMPKRKQVFKVWQDRFDDVVIRSVNVLNIQLNYIHSNPLQEHWNLVDRPELWSFGSAAYYEKGEETPVRVTDYRDYF